MRSRARGSAALGALSASYVLGRPFATLVGAPGWVRLGLVPACAAWSAGLAVTGAASALRIGMRVRRAPVLRSRPRLLATLDEIEPVVSLVSDTHLSARGKVPAELVADPSQWPLGELPGSDVIADRLRAVLAHIKQHAARTVIWCGDEVDTGDPREWERWREVTEELPELAHRLVPGNHDICFNRPFDEDYALGRRAVRERAYQEHGGSLGDFPIVDTIITDAGPANVVLLDSCRHRSRHVLSNAIGHFGDVQLAELEGLLARMRGPLLVIAHHHVWRDERFLDPETWFETAVDADRLNAILTAYQHRGNSVLVCHGHRHILTAGIAGEIPIVGLPSTTLGDKSVAGTLDGVLRYAIAGLRRTGGWGVAVVTVASAENVANT